VEKFQYIAFYDLDHTILEGNSATYLVEEARKRGLMSVKRFRHAVWISILYKLRIGNSTKMILRMLTWLEGLSVSDIDQLCEDVFTTHLKSRIRPEIIKSMEEHRAKKGAIVLLSSASEPICRHIFAYLKMDDMICSRLESVDGFLTGKTSGALVYAREKANRLIAYCKKHGFKQSEAYHYGDSFTDEFVMREVGFPVAVNPDKKLLGIALKKGWSVIVRRRA
jgi:putative phosphoserine phosphatase/1-acylglycerol-3-phosphate O-acyltransferase